MVKHGVPEHIRSDNGPEMVAEQLRDWLEHVGTKTAYITPGSPWRERLLRIVQWQNAR